MNMDITWRCLHRFILSLFLLVFANACCAQIFTSITPVYYHTDLVGSPVAQTDEEGSILWKADRYPYGQEYEPDPNSFNETVGYAGHAFDRDTDLVYMQARYYDPLVGRFYGVDPQGVNAGNPNTFNRYAYSANNPFSYRDPNGEWVETAWDVFNVSIGVASFADNYSQGNYLSATLDAVGLVFDTAAVIVPGLPAGASNIIKASRAADEVSAVVTSVAKRVDTPHTINTGGKAPKTSDPNSIIESRRADGSSSTTYYDDKGRAFSREDYGQQSTHGSMGQRADGRSVAHEHRFDYNDRGYPVKQNVYRPLSESGTPAGPWIGGK
jgi:RHS repeat-associated protein